MKALSSSGYAFRIDRCGLLASVFEFCGLPDRIKRMRSFLPRHAVARTKASRNGPDTCARIGVLQAQILLTAVLLISPPVVCQVTTRPDPPADQWQGTNFKAALGISLVSEEPFDPSVHGSMTPSGEKCSNELNAAIYRQDVLHAFESRAHFDNCEFDAALNYMASLIGEAAAKIGQITPGQVAGDVVPPPLLEGMLAYGQALHAIQDFYAHSNYVELMQKLSPGMTSEAAMPVVEVWTPSGRAQIRNLISKGLVSGRVWWSLPHACSSDVALHRDLAKDSMSTPAGLNPSIWTDLGGRRIANFTVSYNLASRATGDFLRWAAKTTPSMRKYCGDVLKYIVQSELRGAEIVNSAWK